MILSNRIMRIQSGMVVGVPISANDAMNAAHIEVAIQEALKEANALKLEGKGLLKPVCIGYVNSIHRCHSFYVRKSKQFNQGGLFTF